MKILYIIATTVFVNLCFSCNAEKDKFTNIFYDPQERMLFLVNIESASYIHKLELNLQPDTLLISIYKKNVYKSKQFKASLFSHWKIKIKSDLNVEYIKYGDKILRLSELPLPSKELLDTFYPSVEICPMSFPYTAK